MSLRDRWLREDPFNSSGSIKDEDEEVDVEGEDLDDDAEENPKRKGGRKKGATTKRAAKRKSSRRKTKRAAARGHFGSGVGSKGYRGVGKKTRKRKSAAKRKSSTKRASSKLPKGITGRVKRLEGAVRTLTHNDGITRKVVTSIARSANVKNGATLRAIGGYRKVPGVKAR